MLLIKELQEINGEAKHVFSRESKCVKSSAQSRQNELICYHCTANCLVLLQHLWQQGDSSSLERDSLMSLWSVSCRFGAQLCSPMWGSFAKSSISWLETEVPQLFSTWSLTVGQPGLVLNGGSQVLRKWKHVRSLENVGLELVNCYFPYILLSNQVSQSSHIQGVVKQTLPLRERSFKFTS